jgi:hypothetical protein
MPYSFDRQTEREISPAFIPEKKSKRGKRISIYVKS